MYFESLLPMGGLYLDTEHTLHPACECVGNSEFQPGLNYLPLCMLFIMLFSQLFHYKCIVSVQFQLGNKMVPNLQA